MNYEKYLYNDSSFNTPGFDPKNISKTRFIYLGKVIAINDDKDAMRIKVNIPELDINIIEDNLPFCYPFNPASIGVFPKVGESVYVLIPDSSYPYNDRLWSGPILRQYQLFEKDNNVENKSYNGIQDFFEKIFPSFPPIHNNKDAKDIVPDKENITFNSRKNSDIILMPNGVEIRAGKALTSDTNKKNLTNPANIVAKIKDDGTQSHVNIIADKINLITHSGTPNFPPDINEKETDKFIAEAHPLAFGDVEVEFLILLRDALINHIHPYHGKEAISSEVLNKLKNFDINTMLSKNIKIN